MTAPEFRHRKRRGTCRAALIDRRSNRSTSASGSLGAQPCPAPGTACIDDRPSAAGFHAGAETVIPLAFDDARLKSALHDDQSGTFEGVRNLPCLSPNFKENRLPRDRLPIPVSNSRWFKKSSKYKVIERYGKNFFVKFFRNSGIIQFQFHEPGEIGCVNHQIANT